MDSITLMLNRFQISKHGDNESCHLLKPKIMKTSLQICQQIVDQVKEQKKGYMQGFFALTAIRSNETDQRVKDLASQITEHPLKEHHAIFGEPLDGEIVELAKTL